MAKFTVTKEYEINCPACDSGGVKKMGIRVIPRFEFWPSLYLGALCTSLPDSTLQLADSWMDRWIDPAKGERPSAFIPLTTLQLVRRDQSSHLSRAL